MYDMFSFEECLCLFGKSAKLKQLNIPLHIAIKVYENPKNVAVVSKYSHFCENIILPFLLNLKSLVTNYVLYKFNCLINFKGRHSKKINMNNELTWLSMFNIFSFQSVQ